MPDAVIVSTARSPIGRAFAGAGYVAPEIFSVRPSAGAMRLA